MLSRYLRTSIFTLLILVGSVAMLQAQERRALNDLSDSASYMLGYRFGNSLVEQRARLNHEILLAGIADALQPDRTPILSKEVLTAAAMKADSVERGLMARVERGDTNFDPQAIIYGTVSTHGPTTMGTWNDTVSYMVGFTYGSNLQQRGYVAKTRAFSLGMKDRTGDRQPRIDEQGELLIQLALQQKRAEEEAETPDFREADIALMREVAASPDSRQLQNGIYYKVLKEGNGTMPAEGEKLVLNIVSSFVGEAPYFDSKKTDEAIIVALDEVAPFLREAIGQMSIGASYRVYLPGEVAFAHAPADVPRRMTIYDIDLVGTQQR